MLTSHSSGKNKKAEGKEMQTDGTVVNVAIYTLLTHTHTMKPKNKWYASHDII